MALYKYQQWLQLSNDPAFDTEQGPGTQAPHSGIYRCRGCSREVASNQGQPLPPQNHHQHQPGQGSIRWLLIVYADHEGKS